MTRPGTDPAAAGDVPPLPPLAHGARIGAVVSSYHSHITGGMLTSARETLFAAGLQEDQLIEIEAPGAFELPVIAQRLARREDMAAVLCFGLVLRGETDHDRYISSSVADALMRIGLEQDKPVLFGVLTCNNREQAVERARSRADGGLDKGNEVALATIGALRALHQASQAESGVSRETTS